MADSVKVTPASRKIEFFNPTTAAAKATISLDTSGNLSLVADGTLSIGDTSSDIYVGDGSSNVDIVYTVDGEIRTEGSGVELSIVSDENIKFPGSGNVGIGVANPYAKLSVDTNFLVSVPADTADPKVEGILQRITGNTNDNPSMEIFFVENHNLNYGFRMHFDGTNNRMRFYTHSNSTSGSEVMRFNRDAGSDIWLGLASNKVMIGNTSAPKFPLHLKYTDTRTDPQGSGSGTGAGAIGATAEGGGLYIENASTANGVWSGVTFRSGTADARIAYTYLGGPNSGDNDGFNEGQMSFYLDVDDADVYALSEVLRLRGGSTHANSATDYNLAYVNGRVGVGTTTPTTDLHIGQPGTTSTHYTALTLDNGLNSNGGRGVGMDFRVRFGDTNIHNSQIYFDFYGDKWTNSIGMNYYSGRTSGGNSFGNHIFRSDIGVQMIIDSEGDVGIGAFTHVTRPDASLHLKGSAGGEKILIEDTGTDSNPALEIKNDAAHWKFQNRGGDVNKLRICEGSNVRMVVQTNGNVGINDTSPSYRLDVSGDGRFTSNLISNTRVLCDVAVGSVEMNRTDGIFLFPTASNTEQFVTGGLTGNPTYSTIAQNLAAVTTQANCVRVSQGGMNSTYQISAAGKLYLFAVVLHGDGSVADHFQSFDATVFCSAQDSSSTSFVHRKSIHCLYDGASDNLIYQYNREMENFTNNAFDVKVEYAAGDSTVAGLSTGNLKLALVYIDFPTAWASLAGNATGDKILAEKMNWSWEFTGLKDEAHVG